MRKFHTVLRKVIELLGMGGTIIVHCIDGIHRAALCFAMAKAATVLDKSCELNVLIFRTACTASSS